MTSAAMREQVTMSAVIGCDSFLSLRNVRNGNLGQRVNRFNLVRWLTGMFRLTCAER
jgi:hypothetical protein